MDPAAGDAAGSIGAAVGARQDLDLTPTDAVRFTGQLAGGWWSPAPLASVDPRVWTRWGADHPVVLRAGASWIARPWRDVRTDVGLSATSNSGPSLDSIGAHANAIALLGGDFTANVGISLRQYFADADRAAARGSFTPRVGVEWQQWRAERDRLAVWVRAELPDGLPEGGVGIGYWWTGGRGFHDFAPDSVAFQTARGLE
jgi:hypothetical protein